MNLNAIPVSSESIMRRFRLRPVYGVFLWLWIATSLAHAEPGISSSETARTRAFASVVLVILIGLLLGFGALIAWLPFRTTWRRPKFYVITLLIVAVMGGIGWVTGIIPLILGLAAFMAGGRTM